MLCLVPYLLLTVSRARDTKSDDWCLVNKPLRSGGWYIGRYIPPFNFCACSLDITWYKIGRRVSGDTRRPI